MPREVILTSNGPGELYTWARPVLNAWRAAEPDARVSIAMVPCQFASGSEVEVAKRFAPDTITSAAQFTTSMALGRAPAGLQGSRDGMVISLGGGGAYAAALGRKLGMPAFRYAFNGEYASGIARTFVPDDATRKRVERNRALQRSWRRETAPESEVEVVGNLVADAVDTAGRVAHPGSPHILLMAGSRDALSRHLIPFVLAVADALAPHYPQARFVWPVPRSLSANTIQDGIDGIERATLGGIGGRRVDQRVITAAGAVVDMVDEDERYAHMRAATVALTIPGTNTLELGIAAVPTLVVLPLNRPEIIPLEGFGHWLSLIPVVGVPLKRRAVKLFVEGMKRPFSLPNRFSGERLMEEMGGSITVDAVVASLRALLDDPTARAHRQERMRATMPQPGAAARMVTRLQTLIPRATPDAEAASAEVVKA